MERNLVLPAQPPYQETDVLEAEKPQPYLEAKLYIERIEQENKVCQEEKGTDRTHEPLEGPEPSEHGVSLMMYPIRVPSMHLPCATVQWDMQHTSTEDRPSDAASVDKPDCSDGAGLDLAVNPLSLDTPSSIQEGFIDLIPEHKAGQTHSDAELQQEPAATVDNFCQIGDGEDIDDHVCVVPSNEMGQGPCEDTSQTSEDSADSGSVKAENSTDRTEDTVCIEELETQVDLQSLETLEVDEHFLTEQAFGDACTEKEGLGLYSVDGNERDSVSKNGASLEVIAHEEEDRNSNTSSQQEQEQEDAGESVELDLMEELDQTLLPTTADPPVPAEKPPDCLFDASRTVDATDSEKMEPKQEPEISQTERPEATGNSENLQQTVLVATLDMISDDKELVQLEQLQHAETFQKTQGSAWVDNQGEPTRDEQSESSVETEFAEHGECSVRLEPSEESECLDKLEQSEESKEQERSVGEEPSKEPEKFRCSAKTELLGQSEISKETQPSEESQEQESSVDEEPSDESEKFQCKTEPLEQSEGSRETQPSEQSKQSEGSSEAETSEQSKQTECYGENEPSPLSNRENGQQTNQLDQLQQTETQQHMENAQLNEDKEQSEHVVDQTEQSLAEHMHDASVQKSVIPLVPHENGIMEVVDREEARRLAERLYKLENVQRTDVVRHLDKDTEFSRAVGEEYLKFYDFTDQTLDEALRSFLKEVVLIGETQERERVLDRFSSRYQQCNPNSFSSPGPVLTLTCALMLLNTDLHGQNVGKAMSFTDFMSNMDGMNEGENFSKDLLKTLYNSIKNHPLEWAVEEKELVKSMILEKDSDQDASLRSKSNPFQDLAHDKKATVFQKGFLKRKAHADIDGKRTPWGKRSWKTFYAVLKGMVLYLQKDEYRKDWQSSEEVLSVHHSLAERAEDYTKRPHVFRLQTADWRVFLFEAASTEQMNSWIGRINLVSALYSSPPFPAAVGSQRKFCRPILPATQSALTLEKQLQSHARMLQSFQEDLSALQQGVTEGRKAKARELEEHRLREEYLQHERCRYEAYIQILDVWQMLGKSSEAAAGTDLALFDQELWKGVAVQEEDSEEIDGGMKRSHSSPSLELELAPPPVVKVRRNISERRTYRKIVIPRRNKEL